MSRGPILLTGGSGFIGTHLAKKLRAEGADVRIFDLRARDAAGRGDIRNLAELEAAARGVSAIVHFAAIVSVPECEKDPVGSERTNVEGTRNVIRAALQSGGDTLPRIVFASSAALYGDHAPGPEGLSESLPPRPLSAYGRHKLEGEHLLEQAFRERGLPSVVFRFFNVFGPGQDPSSPYSGVISRFALKLAERQPLEIFGTGEQTRDFISVHDIVDACAEAVLRLPRDACRAEPMNLGTHRACSVLELGRVMSEVWGASGFEPKLHPPRAGDVMHSLADLRRVQERMPSWAPRRGLREGLVELRETL